ncbi:hypothetical protein Tco_1262459 [Tanacetum coccineum]
MAARGGRNNIVARRVIDDLIDISGERSPPTYLKIFIEQQITDHRRFIARMRDEIRTLTNLISQLNALIAELEAFGDYEEVFDLVMRRIRWPISIAFALVCEAPMCLIRIAVGNVVSGFWQVYSEVLIMETQAINDQDHLVNYDNDNENDDLGYRSDEYFDEADGNNHSNGNVVKRGITRISGKHRALFSSFLGYMVVAFIGFEDSYLKTVDSGKQEINYGMKINVKKLVMNHLGQLLRNFRKKLRKFIHLPFQIHFSKLNEVPAKYSAILKVEEWVNFVKYTATEEYKIEKKEIEPDEEPARGTLWLKGRVNKDEEYPDDEIRSVGDKLKETEDKIKEGTLKVDHGTDAMTVVLGKEKGGYARGVGSGVTYKRYFDLPRSRQASNERILLLQSQLDNERHERQEKELLIRIWSKLDVSPVDINPINSSADEEGGTTIVGCENDASIQKSNGLATLEKEIETRDCYKVSIDTSLVDAACIPDVGNNGFKTVKDAVGGFFAWPKDLVVFDPKATPPSTIQMNVENKTAPKLQTKRKNVYVSSDAMQRQAKKKSLQKSLNY